MDNLKRKDILYFARIIPSVSIYDVCELSVRTVADTWFTAIDKRDKHVYLYYYNDIGATLFKERTDALNKVKNAEKNKKIINEEIYYEEY